MLRIHFTAQDLARTKIACQPDPMWEVLLSLYLLRASHGAVVFDRWRLEARRRLRGAMQFLQVLVPVFGSSPDFLTPAGDGTLECRIETLLGTPRDRLRADVALIAQERTLPVWSADLARGRPEVLRALGGEIHHYFHRCLAPHWDQARQHVERDAASRVRTVAHGGIDALLATLVPGGRWVPPVLELHYPVDRSIQLDGRGLILQPAFFDHPSPSGQFVTTLVDPSLPPVLVYPVDHQYNWISTAETPGSLSADPLDALLGRTRARVLRAIADGPCTTSELATRAAAPLSTVSRHASILRDAGLLTSHRDRNTVLHLISPLGTSLCQGNTLDEQLLSFRT